MSTVAVTTDSKTIEMIELALIQVSPDNPRKTFDQKALEELAASIASEGIHVPLLIRVFEGEKRYELIAGERRLRASKIAGKTEVPCVCRQYTDEEARAARIIESGKGEAQRRSAQAKRGRLGKPLAGARGGAPLSCLCCCCCFWQRFGENCRCIRFVGWDELCRGCWST